METGVLWELEVAEAWEDSTGAGVLTEGPPSRKAVVDSSRLPSATLVGTRELLMHHGAGVGNPLTSLRLNGEQSEKASWKEGRIPA